MEWTQRRIVGGVIHAAGGRGEPLGRLGGETHRPDTAGLRDPGGEVKVHGKGLTRRHFQVGQTDFMVNPSMRLMSYTVIKVKTLTDTCSSVVIIGLCLMVFAMSRSHHMTSSGLHNLQ